MGDRAPTTTLPERFTRERGDEVYIAANFRNRGVADFWYRDNPYVCGIVSEGATHQIQLGDEHYRLLFEHESNVAAHEAFFGLPPPYNKYPRIYWTPGYLREFAGKVLVDASGITTPYTKDAFEPHLRALLHWKAIASEDMVLMEPPDDASRGAMQCANYPTDVFPDIPRWKPRDAFEQAAAIHSCKIFATNESGGAAMAVAIKARTGHPRIVPVISNHTFNLMEWRWPDVFYFTQSKLRGDWG